MPHQPLPSPIDPGPLPRSPEMVQALVLANHRLVYPVARRLYSRRHRDALLSLEDSYQWGMVGLLQAAQKFDPTRGVLFSTYATITIRNTILAVRCNNGLIHVPASIFKSNRVDGDAFRTAGAKARQRASLDTHPHLGGRTFPTLPHSIQYEEWEILKLRLNPAELQLLHWRYWEERPYRWIAQQLGCCSERVRQKLVQVMRKLRKEWNAYQRTCASTDRDDPLPVDGDSRGPLRRHGRRRRGRGARGNGPVAA